MYLCYVDESGTPDVPGNSSHYVLAGLSVPIWHWKTCDSEILGIKKQYGLEGAEIHTGWILRSYIEQSKIPSFANLKAQDRRRAAERYRNETLLRLQKEGGRRYRQAAKNFKKTLPYVHLTFQERQEFIRDVAQCISDWGFARLFAECVDKIHHDPSRALRNVEDQAFEQLVSRFEKFLRNMGAGEGQRPFGLLIHDNNQTVARRHTELMAHFRKKGTVFTGVERIIETPLYVDSQLTSMVQIADLCAYALRRYLENSEEELFDLVFQRADRKDGLAVGVRHYTVPSCRCTICRSHRPPQMTRQPELVPTR